MDLRIARARSYAAQDKWALAEIALNKALDYAPDNVRALRYRADARHRLDKLDLAKADIERALTIDGENIDGLLVRGQINEAIRLRDIESEEN